VPVCLAEFLNHRRQGGLAEVCAQETLMAILVWVLDRNDFENNRFGATVET
jgi:hypothetical protein